MFKNKVAKGAAVLDKKHPTWESMQDLERLDLGDVCDCIIGQAYPDEPYIVVIYDLLGTEAISDSETDEYGFSTPDCRDYPALTQEWKQFITKRREQKNVLI